MLRREVTEMLRRPPASCTARWVGAVAFASFVVLQSPVSSAQAIDRVEAIPIQTTSPPTQQFLTGAKGARPARIAAELRIPKPKLEKLSAVILIHGCGGMGAKHDRWVQELNDIGVATFTVDSFAGRGIVDTRNDQSQLSTLAMMVDAYR